VNYSSFSQSLTLVSNPPSALLGVSPQQAWGKLCVNQRNFGREGISFEQVDKGISIAKKITMPS
jgi:hypothetical protein